MFLDETFRVKVGLAEMLKGGVIMDVTNDDQALIAEKAGAAAVMALERVPADIRKEGGVARMAPINKMREIMQAVSIPVMAKARIGHFSGRRRKVCDSIRRLSPGSPPGSSLGLYFEWCRPGFHRVGAEAAVRVHPRR